MGVGERAVQRNVAGHVVVDAGMAVAGLLENAFQMVGNFHHRGVDVFRQGELDHQTRDLAVAGDKPSRDFSGVQRDISDSFQIGVGQRAGILDERLNDQLVAVRPAVRIVG